MSQVSRVDQTTTTPSTPTTDQLRPGESLEAFAARHQVTPQAVRAANADTLQSLSNDRRHHDPGLSESAALQGVDLQVPPTPMSVTEDGPTSDFNPTYSSSNSDYGVGADGANAGGAVSWNPGDGTVSLTGSQIATPPGQTDTAAVQFEARRDTSVTLGQSNADGNTEFNVEVEFAHSASAQGGVTTGRGTLDVEAGAGAGTRARYNVTLPGENQNPAAAAAVNPFDPTTIPVGGSVTMDGQAFTQTELAASFRNIATQTSVTEAAGASYSVTRVDENNIRVTMGPNQAVEAFNGVGVSTDIATAMLGRQDSLGGSFVGTAQFDLSNPDAQAAYAHFVATGEVANGTPGVSDVAQIGRIDYASQTRLQLELGPLSADLAGAENTGSRVDVTYPDGSRSSTIGLQYSGNVPLQVTQRFDASGAEIISERSYGMTVNTDHDVDVGWFDRMLGANEQEQEASLELSHAQLLNAAFTGSTDGSGPVVPGQTATIAFSEAQMQSLLGQTREAAAANESGMDTLALLAGGENGQPPATTMDFAVAMARNLGGSDWGSAERFLQIAQGADGDITNGLSRIDATVTSE